jgi:hypothetical protein
LQDAVLEKILMTNGDIKCDSMKNSDDNSNQEKAASEREMEAEEAKKIVESITDSITNGEKQESK